MENDKKPTLSPPQAPPPALPASLKRGWLLGLTRETRLGLLVAGSFIVLVAGVLLVKNSFTSKPAAEPAPEVAAAKNPPSTPPSTPPAKRSPADSTGTIQRTRHDAPVILDPDPPPAIVDPMKNGDPLVIDPPPIVLPGDVEPIIPPERPAKKDPFKKSGKSDPRVVADPPVRLEVPFKRDPLDEPPVIDIKVPDDPRAPVVKNPVIRVGAEEKKDAAPKIEPPIDPPPAIEPVIEIKQPNDPMKKDPPLKIEIPNDPMKKDPPVIVDPPPGIDPPEKKDPPLVIDPPMKKDPPLVVDPPMKKDPPLVVDPPMKKDPLPLEISPKVEPMPKPDIPKADGGYDEDLHTLKPNETYRSLSKQYYNSEAYATALQRYNADHPGRADYVRVPPIWVLEKKYPSDVANGPARVNYAPPPAADLSPRTEPTYTVAENGEMLADVAKKALGSEDAWKRVWDLNPQLNPAKLIPGGTRLRLPGQ
jgi:hypothetical protein